MKWRSKTGSTVAPIPDSPEIPDNPSDLSVISDPHRRNSTAISVISRSLSILPNPIINRDSLENSRHKLHDDLESLADNNTIFIQRFQQDESTSSKSPSWYFQVVTSGGYCLYDILETQSDNAKRQLKMKQVVTLAMVSRSGDKICEIIWDGDTTVTLQRNSSVLGKVVLELKSCCIWQSPPKYTIHNETGEPVQTIFRSNKELLNCVTTDIFNVFSLDIPSSLLGSISRRWEASSGPEISSPVYAVAFLADTKMQRVEKALWVAAVALMDFHG